jgi:radical SAM protein with 4Fe4S-binding SPASM domain
MDMELYKTILKEVRGVFKEDELNIITFSVYNEPTLDPHLLDRIRLLTDMGYTHQFVANCSEASKEMVDTIINEKLNVTEFRINLATVNPSECQKIMGITPTYLDFVLARIAYICEKSGDIPVRIMVNGNGTEDHKEMAMEVYETFKHYDIQLSMSGLVNRAGMLDHIVEGKIKQPFGIGLRCRMNYFDNLYVGIKGNLYVCCNDYYQEYSYGTIGEKPLIELLESDERRKMIRSFTAKRCKQCSMAM